MLTIKKILETDFDLIAVDPFWNIGEDKEQKMHKIHAYPAKFPSFITTKALEYAEKQGIKPTKVADIFCGCGTVSYEAKRNNINFWGCDINPVATMIAKVKSHKFQEKILISYQDKIISNFSKRKFDLDIYKNANERLKYWYSEKRYIDLYNLKKSIEKVTPKGSNYRLFFLCAFSNILKPTSRWLTKSIKPQIDPHKKIGNVIDCYLKQFEFMYKANLESDIENRSNTQILTRNYLDPDLTPPKVDMIVTSPPYVTSYEYADLHQLSTLWLDYTVDYKAFREGAIGSSYHKHDYESNFSSLNSIGLNIVTSLLKKDKSGARAVAKYFVDMQEVAKRCYKMLSSKGISVFVIGNTEYKGIKIDNAKHLSIALSDAGFTSISATKRKISFKALPTYRTKNGRFTSNKLGKKIYAEEFIIIAKK